MEIVASCICSIIVSSIICVLLQRKIMLRHLKKHQAVFYLGESENTVTLGTLDEFMALKKSQNSAGTK